ncbi:unnamed protein product [Absidia cylindrospora]
MTAGDHLQLGKTTATIQYQPISNTERISITKHIGQANHLVGQIKLNGLIPSTPKQKSPLSISHTPSDEGDTNNKDAVDLLTYHDDFANVNIVDYVNKNHLNAPWTISSTSTNNLEFCSSHEGDTRGRKHVNARKSSDINNSTNSISKHNNILFDNASRFYRNGKAKYNSSLTSQINTPSAKNERRQSGSNRLSWVHYIDKKQRGFFDKHQRVNDEVAAASNKPSFLSAKTPTATTSAFPSRLVSYLSCKLSISPLKVINNNSNNKNQPQRRRYAKNRRKTKKSTSQHSRLVTPKKIDDTTGNGGQQRRGQPLLESDVYRMSHMKLTNPRRPLREQVTIINSMFRYLSTLPAKHQQQHNQQQWRLLYHITSPSNQATPNTPSPSLKRAPAKTAYISQSTLPYLKNTSTSSSTTL